MAGPVQEGIIVSAVISDVGVVFGVVVRGFSVRRGAWVGATARLGRREMLCICVWSAGGRQRHAAGVSTGLRVAACVAAG